MRIRRNASKLLGSASSFPSSSSSPLNPWPSPSPWPPHASDSGAGILCELNRSPWDVMLPHRLQEDEGEEEEEEERRGIMGNGIKAERPEEEADPVTAITSTAAELTIRQVKAEAEEAAEKKKKGASIVEAKEKVAKKGRKRKEKAMVTSANIIANCKKSDGKGWKCKRPAQLPHTLCHYHLAQLRSYNYSTHSPHKPSEPAAETNGRSRRRRAAVVESAAGDSNFYYYYSGFGPWRGKRRGGGGGDHASTTISSTTVNGAFKEEDEDDYGRESRENSESGNGFDSPVVCDVYEDDDDDDDDSLDRNGSSDGEPGRGEKRDNGLVRKRRRKPVKARSLKSLL